MSNWKNCRNILCIRPDNMGDLLMSGPAIRALRSSFDARITVLTSTMAAGIARLMPEIDEVIVFDLPWVKTASGSNEIEQLITNLRERHFDAAVIFTVFSQSSLPTAMLAYQCGIPKVLSYCRENPYELISNWIPDEEPYSLIRHQVERDLNLVNSVGARVPDERLRVDIPEHLWPDVQAKLSGLGCDSSKPWIIIHPGVSEYKRQYPAERWIAAGKILLEQGYQLVLTGTSAEQDFAASICQEIGGKSMNAAGTFTLDELVCLISHSLLLLAVNTGPVHLAAAVGTPVVVLYAQTNPQHTPWKVSHEVLEFPVPAALQSKNEVLKYLRQTIYQVSAQLPDATAVVNAVDRLLQASVPADRRSL